LGETVMVAPPEYVIIRKLEYFREGGPRNTCVTFGACLPYRVTRWTERRFRIGFAGEGWRRRGRACPGESCPGEDGVILVCFLEREAARYGMPKPLITL
jgi:hypothetical protein